MCLLTICTSSLENCLFRSAFLFFFFWQRHAACRILVPQPGIKPVPSTMEVQSPNHRTAREFLCPFFDWVVCFLDTELHGPVIHLGDEALVSHVIIYFVSHGKYFLPSVGCLFVLFMVSFAVQKLLSLIRSHLFIFAFTFITLGGGSKKILLQFM